MVPQLNEDPDRLDDVVHVQFVHSGLQVIPPAEIPAVKDALPRPLRLCAKRCRS